jgi:hypothetical protein
MRRRLLVFAALVIVGLFISLALRPSGRAAERPNDVARTTVDVAPARAASDFLVGLDADTLLDPVARRRHIARWATRAAALRLQHVYDSEASRLGNLRRGFARPALMGYTLKRSAAGTAGVRVWAVSVASTGRGVPIVAWRTIAVKVVHEGGTWRIDAVRDVEGPPLDADGPRFRKAARAFREFHAAP